MAVHRLITQPASPNQAASSSTAPVSPVRRSARLLPASTIAVNSTPLVNTRKRARPLTPPAEPTPFKSNVKSTPVVNTRKRARPHTEPSDPSNSKLRRPKLDTNPTTNLPTPRSIRAEKRQKLAGPRAPCPPNAVATPMEVSATAAPMPKTRAGKRKSLIASDSKIVQEEDEEACTRMSKKKRSSSVLVDGDVAVVGAVKKGKLEGGTITGGNNGYMNTRSMKGKEKEDIHQVSLEEADMPAPRVVALRPRKRKGPSYIPLPSRGDATLTTAGNNEHMTTRSKKGKEKVEDVHRVPLETPTPRVPSPAYSNLKPTSVTTTPTPTPSSSSTPASTTSAPPSPTQTHLPLPPPNPFSQTHTHVHHHSPLTPFAHTTTTTTTSTSAITSSHTHTHPTNVFSSTTPPPSPPLSGRPSPPLDAVDVGPLPSPPQSPSGGGGMVLGLMTLPPPMQLPSSVMFPGSGGDAFFHQQSGGDRLGGGDVVSTSPPEDGMDTGSRTGSEGRGSTLPSESEIGFGFQPQERFGLGLGIGVVGVEDYGGFEQHQQQQGQQLIPDGAGAYQSQQPPPRQQPQQFDDSSSCPPNEQSQFYQQQQSPPLSPGHAHYYASVPKSSSPLALSGVMMTQFGGSACALACCAGPSSSSNERPPGEEDGRRSQSPGGSDSGSEYLSPSLRRKPLQQQQPQQYERPQTASRQHRPMEFASIHPMEEAPTHKYWSLWKIACRTRVHEITKRYTAEMIRNFAMQEAHDYYAVRRFPPGFGESDEVRGRRLRQQRRQAKEKAAMLRRVARGADNGEGSGEPGGEEGGEGEERDDEFMRERIYPFELLDDDEAEGAESGSGVRDGDGYGEMLDDDEGGRFREPGEHEDDDEIDFDDEKFDGEELGEEELWKFGEGGDQIGEKDDDEEETDDDDHEEEDKVSVVIDMYVNVDAVSHPPTLPPKASTAPGGAALGAFAPHDDQGTVSGDEDAEGEMEVDIEAFQDPTFNAELSSPGGSPMSPAEREKRSRERGKEREGKGSLFSSFYIAPLPQMLQQQQHQQQQQFLQQQQQMTQVPSLQDVPELQLASALPSADLTDPIEPSPSPPPTHQHQPPQIISLPIHIPMSPIMPLPPPRLDSFPAPLLRQNDYNSKVTGRGTPADRRRGAMWALGQTAFWEQVVAGRKRRAEDEEGLGDLGEEEGERKKPRLRLSFPGEDERERVHAVGGLSLQELPMDVPMDVPASSADVHPESGPGASNSEVGTDVEGKSFGADQTNWVAFLATLDEKGQSQQSMDATVIPPSSSEVSVTSVGGRGGDQDLEHHTRHGMHQPDHHALDHHHEQDHDHLSASSSSPSSPFTTPRPGPGPPSPTAEGGMFGMNMSLGLGGMGLGMGLGGIGLGGMGGMGVGIGMFDMGFMGMLGGAVSSSSPSSPSVAGVVVGAGAGGSWFGGGAPGEEQQQQHVHVGLGHGQAQSQVQVQTHVGGGGAGDGSTSTLSYALG
ncbi:hypothetical protein B0H34DRAFT_196490 [Crassisporium funariophilum]|nr:hypothetical protein B0H34DRAFT_196490 [Crassisporium funariophilum]